MKRVLSQTDSGRFGRGLEAAGWLLTILLGSLAFLLPHGAAPDRQAKLLAFVAVLAAANLLFHRVMPDSSDGPIRFAREDKALVVSLAMVLLVSVFLYIVPESAGELAYLYLVPLFASSLVLHEKVVMAEAVFSMLALLFMHSATWSEGPFWSGELIIRLVIFSAVSVGLSVVTRALRLAFGRADRLSGELSVRLDQLQVINMLVRQGEYTSQMDILAARAGEIVADAVDTERHVIFVLDREAGGLRRVGDGGGLDHYDRELLSVDGNLQVLRGVMETGTSRVFDGGPGGIERFIGNARIRDMLVVPLRVRDASIGVLCLVNRRNESFADEDIHYCELLAGFVATLMHAAMLFRKTLEERQTVERMAKLMVGREIRMRELKGRIGTNEGV